jgi:hypothetical protein
VSGTSATPLLMVFVMVLLMVLLMVRLMAAFREFL